MTPDELKKRIRAFALRCLKLVGAFPKGQASDVIGRQLIKSSTSSAANYSSACVARSKADFISKLAIVEEEVDESVFWIDFSADAGLSKRRLIDPLLCEGREILAIVIASLKTAKSGQAGATRMTRSS